MSLLTARLYIWKGNSEKSMFSCSKRLRVEHVRQFSPVINRGVSTVFWVVEQHLKHLSSFVCITFRKISAP